MGNEELQFQVVTQGTASNEYNWVGKRILRPDGGDKVNGRADFLANFQL